MSQSHVRSMMLAAGLAVTFAAAASAVPPVQLADINPTAPNAAGSSHPVNIKPTAGGRAIFFAASGPTGYEPFTTNGTEPGTTLLKDITSGGGSSVPVFGGGEPGANIPMTNIETTTTGISFFFANDGSTGYELWKTDGTVNGTVRVSDINPGSFGCLSTVANPNTIFVDSEATNFNYRAYFKAAGPNLYFSALNATDTVPQLHVTNGTTITRIAGFPYSRGFTELPFAGNKVLFCSGVGAVSAWYLFDPSDNSVVPMSLPSATTTATSIAPPLVHNNKVYFMTLNGTVGEIFSFDGTNTVQVSNMGGLAAGGGPRVQMPLTIMGTKLFYIASIPGITGTDLCFTDLSNPAANSTVIQVEPGLGASFPRWPVVVGSSMYFAAQSTAGGLEIWKTDGTQAGTTQVTNLGAGAAPSLPTFVSQGFGTQPTPLLAIGTKIIFAGGSALVQAPVGLQGNPVVTGTGTLKVIDTAAGDAISDLNTDAVKPYYMTSMGSYALLSATSTANGRELWRTDGTAAGTSLVRDLNTILSDSAASRFTKLDDNTTIFVANNGTGETFWKTGGSGGTTNQLGVNGNTFPRNLTSVPNGAGNRVYASINTANGYELGFTDGTGVFAFNLDNRTPATGQDGMGFPSAFLDTAANTIALFEDTRIGFSADRRYTPSGYASIGGNLLFMGQNGGDPANNIEPSGRELFIAGPAGAAIVKDIFPGNDGNNPATSNSSLGWLNAAAVAGQARFMPPNAFFDFNGKVYFAACDGGTALAGSPFTSGNSELYVTDGTELGTVLAADINFGVGGSDPHDFIRLNADSFLFYARGDGSDDELWRADVDPTTGAVTALQVTDINPAGSSWGFWPLFKMGTNVFFAADDGVNGRELWKTDGTAGGTSMVIDLFPGATSSTPGPFLVVPTPAGERIFFYANDGTGGFHYFLSDGTAAGTVALPELNPGANNDGSTTGALADGNDYGTGASADMVFFDGKVYFPGDNGSTGLELFSYDPATGTFALEADINVGLTGSEPQNFFVNGSALYFTANNGINGREPYVINLNPPASACLADVVDAGGVAPGDGNVDGSDFIAFINSFSIGDAAVDPVADVAGGLPSGGDGTIDGTDFIEFINAFSAGC